MTTLPPLVTSWKYTYLCQDYVLNINYTEYIELCSPMCVMLKSGQGMLIESCTIFMFVYYVLI